MTGAGRLKGRRTDQFEAIFGCEYGDLFDEVLVRRNRSVAVGKTVVKEAFDIRRRNNNQHATGDTGAVLEAMARVARGEDTFAGTGFGDFAVDAEGELAFEDEEIFILVVMDVERRATAWGFDGFDGEVGAAAEVAGHDNAVNAAAGSVAELSESVMHGYLKGWGA